MPNSQRARALLAGLIPTWKTSIQEVTLIARDFFPKNADLPCYRRIGLREWYLIASSVTMSVFLWRTSPLGV
jgi:hypothetical protein